MQQRTAWPTIVRSGALAGFVGAILIDAYLLATLVLGAHAVGITAFYQFVVSGALGKAAYANPRTAYFGVVVHLLIGVAWGVGYAYVALRAPQVRARPFLSGSVFGLLVMIAMQLVEVAANVYVLPNTALFFNAIVAHVVFFGLPVAYIVRSRLPAGLRPVRD